MKRSRESSDERDEDLNKLGKKEEEDEVFLDACIEGDLDLVKRWLSNNKVDVNVKDYINERSGIHYAALNGRVDVVKVLLQNGADVNDVDVLEWTALHCAAKKGHVGVVKVLIQNGADVNAVDEEKSTALHYAARYGHVDVAKVLIQKGVAVNAVQEEMQRHFNQVRKDMLTLRKC